jgi:hypothetical protein
MNYVELMTVLDCHEIGGGIVLLPNFSVPNGKWKSRIEKVIIVKTDGQKIDAVGRFNLSHFNYADPSVSLDKRWRVTVSFPEKTKDFVPVGSKIYVPQEFKEALILQENTSQN